MADDSTTIPPAFVPIAISDIPKDALGQCVQNLYIYLPTNHRFILFVPAGEKFTYSKKTSLERHIIPALFVRVGSDDVGATVIAGSSSSQKGVFDVLGEETAAELKGIFKGLTDNMDVLPEQAISRLEKMAEELMQCLAPDVEDLRTRMRQNSQYIWVMNEQAAITSIAVLFAAAYGIDARKPLKDIICAGLVMDLSLVSMDSDVIDQYLLDPAQLDPKLRASYEQHPVLAYRLAKNSLKQFSEATFDLVLNHHELNNGLGFPRGIRSGTLFPLSRVFAAAVETYEILKRSKLRDQPKTLNEAVLEMSQPGVEMHLKRHAKEVTDKILQYLSIEAKT